MGKERRAGSSRFPRRTPSACTSQGACGGAVGRGHRQLVRRERCPACRPWETPSVDQAVLVRSNVPTGEAPRPSTRYAFRRSGVRWFLTVVFCAPVVPAVWLLIRGFGDRPAGEPVPAVERVVAAVLVLLTTWIPIRAARQGIWADRHGVKVRNVLRTHYASWYEVEKIEPPLSYSVAVVWRPVGGEGPGIRFRLHDGRQFNAALYSRGQFEGSRMADDVVGTLRRLHAANSPKW